MSKQKNTEKKSFASRLVGKPINVAAEAKAAPTSTGVIVGLIGGYSIARITGVRPLAAVALGGAAFYNGRRWSKEGGAGRTAALTTLYFGAFGAAHGLSRVIGSWPAVLGVTGVAAGAAWAAHDRKLDQGSDD